MRGVSCSIFLAAALPFLCSAAAVGDTPQNAALRCELTQFVDGLAAVPGLVIDPVEGRNLVASMSQEDLERTGTLLSPTPNWRQIPQVLATVAEAQNQRESERLSHVLAGGSIFDAEGAPRTAPDSEFRADLLFLAEQLDRFSPLMEPEFAQRVARFRAWAAALPDDRLGEARDAWRKQALLRYGTATTASEPTVTAQQRRATVLGCCDLCLDCWISYAFELLDDIASFVTDFFEYSIYSQVAGIAGSVSSYFTQVFNSIKQFVTTQFDTITGALPTTADGVLTYVGGNWNDPNWSQIASSIPSIAPPCPQNAVDIAAEVCNRGGDALTQLLFDVAPDDGLSFLFKVGVALVHLPLTYLCQCNDIQQAIATADAEAAHRTHVATNLDVKATSRATEANLTALRGTLTVLDADVVKAEAKLDVLESTADRIDAKAVTITNTAALIDEHVDTTNATANRIETKVDALTAGNTAQQQTITDFQTLVTRLAIETNLLDVKPNPVSLFQLPTAFGGMLDRVQSIVANTMDMNLAANQPVFGAAREIKRGDALLQIGDFVRAYEAYRSAYAEAVR